jgi:hypothetical protein
VDSSFIQQMKAITDHYDRLIPDYVRHAIREQQRYAKMAEAAARPFLNDLRDVQEQLAGITKIVEEQKRMAESAKHWANALAIVQIELPKRGWYLTGRESGRLTPRLAKLIETEDWHKIDAILVEQASALSLKADTFLEWLTQQSVPNCCIERMRIFLAAREDGQHEIATLVGVPLIDELSRALYDGKDFTTKRHKRQPKPQMACVSGNGASKLNSYCEGFVESFGLIHQDVDATRIEDEDYFNRSAILHGMMRRPYGPKDTAKVFMVLMFLVFAVDDSGKDAANADDLSDAGGPHERS